MKVAINQKFLDNNNLKVCDFEVFSNIKDISKSDTFFFSTVSDCSYLESMKFGYIRNYDISVDKYIAFLKDKFINFDGYFKLACQLNESDINKFCRSNTSYRYWSGQIIKDKIDLNFIKEKVQQDTLLFLASVKYISQEMRLWMIKGKCIEITEYPTWENKVDIKYEHSKLEYIKFVEKIAEDWQPDDMYVIDIGISYNKMYVIEYNPISITGFYSADINKIAKAIKDYFNK